MSVPSAPQRSRTPLIIGIIAAVACLGLVLVVVLVLAVGGVLLARQGPEDPGASSGATASAGELVLPPGVSADQPYLEVATSSEGPTVGLYLDFLCPHCATFHQTQGEDLTQLAADEEITLRVHPRPMLDARSTPPGYSGRAANAAVCAYAEDPAQWFAAEAALFENQPGAEGLTDQELTALVSDATGVDVSSCVAEGTYLPWIQEVVEPEARANTSGTPTVLIDGEKFTGDISSPGSVAEAIAAA